MQLRVSIFNTSSNLPQFAALELGFYKAWGLEVELLPTPNSDAQRLALAEGRIDIAHAAVDNAVAMVESGADVQIVCGGDAGMNELMVRSEINSFEDLRGKLLAVDAPNTAYALVAKKILKNKGLLEGRDYQVKLAGGTGPRSQAMVADTSLAVGMVNPPFSFMVLSRGLKSLGSQFVLLGPYQATGAFVLRRWAEQNSEALVHYLAATMEGYRVVMDARQKEAMLALLVRRFGLSQEHAQASYTSLNTAGSGLAADAELNRAGFAAVLAIRAEMEGMWGGAAPSADRYLNLDYYTRARELARLR